MKKEVVNLLKFVGLGNAELERLIEIPRESEMGDYAFPCFVLAKKFKKNPTEIAKEIAGKIKSGKFEKVEAVGEYVNFFVDRIKLVKKVINEIEKEGDNYGSGKYGKEKIMIEFSQANTHKAFHMGHIRGTCLGESLSRILEFSGKKVMRVNYQGDTGMHVAKWLWDYQKFHPDEELKKDESWIAGIYVEAVKKLASDKTLEEEVRELNRLLESRKDKKLNSLWKKTRSISLKSLEKIYHELNTHFDEYFFESNFEKRGKKIVKELVKKKIAEVSEGATIIDLKKYNLGVWVLLRGDGTVLYSAKDLALAEKKFDEFKIDKSIYVVGAAQKLHFYQLFKTLELMKFKNAKKCEYVPVSEVRFPWGKMSSRSGDNVLYFNFKKQIVDLALKEVEKRYHELESVEVYDRAFAIAIASMKYFMLKQDVNKNLIFNPKESISFEGNTGPYLLYSYARARSILRNGNYKKLKRIKVEKVEEEEKKLANKLGEFREVVKKSGEELAPNLVANYAYELSKTFGEFYHAVKVVGSKNEDFKLKLVDSFSQVIRNALELLGIPVIEEM